jgi:hypothetical protein
MSEKRAFSRYRTGFQTRRENTPAYWPLTTFSETRWCLCPRGKRRSGPISSRRQTSEFSTNKEVEQNDEGTVDHAAATRVFAGAVGLRRSYG